MRSGGVVTVVALLALTACNGDDDTAASTTLAPPPTTNATTTTEVSPSTSAPTTDQTTTTTNTPETTTTSSVDTSTSTSSTPEDDYATQAIEVIARTEASWDAVLTAFADPFNDEKVAALAEFFTNNQLEGFNNLIADFRAGNFRVVPRPDMDDTYDADPRSLTLSVEDGFATVQVCHVDTSITVETGGNPDGTDRVVADDIERQIVELDLVRTDGSWKVSSAREPEEEIAECP